MTEQQVSASQRYTKDRPCPICRGHSDAPRHQGLRCHGYASVSGRYARCSQEAFARGLRQGRDGLYGHLLDGRCNCGKVHGADASAAAKVAKPAKDGNDVARKVKLAQSIWRDSRPDGGAVLARYLVSRGIEGSVPPSLRLHNRLLHVPSGRTMPAMVAAVTCWPGDEPVAIHRTYLSADGSAKATVEPCRMALGPVRGGAVRLAPATEMLVIAEGIETALSIQVATGLPAWSALSAGNLANVVLPALPLAKEVVIGADPDVTGRRAAAMAARRWCAEGRRVRIAVPALGDFNDVLRDSA